MGKIFFSFKKEHKFIIYTGIIQTIIASIMMFKNRMIGKKGNSSIIVIAGYLGNLSIIVLYIFEEILSKRNKYVKLISNVNDKNQKKKCLEIYRKYLLLICVLITRIIHNLFQYNFFYYQIKYYPEFWYFKIEFFALIIIPLIINSKYYFYSHHYFSLVLFFLSFVFDYFKFDKKYFFLGVAYFLNRSFSNAICLNIYEFLNKYEFMNIYLLASIEGLINIIDIILIEFIMKLFNLNALNLYQSFVFFFNSRNLRIVCYINFIFEFIYKYYFFIIIKSLNPSFTPVGNLFIAIFFEIMLERKILPIISLLLSLLGCLIYLEILIIDKCGLGTYVKINIEDRALKSFMNDLELLKDSSFNEDTLEKIQE